MGCEVMQVLRRKNWSLILFQKKDSMDIITEVWPIKPIHFWENAQKGALACGRIDLESQVTSEILTVATQHSLQWRLTYKMSVTTISHKIATWFKTQPILTVKSSGLQKLTRIHCPAPMVSYNIQTIAPNFLFTFRNGLFRHPYSSSTSWHWSETS